MTNLLRFLFVSITCLFLYACTKKDTVNSSSQRLIKVRTNMADSLGNDCATCYVTELFGYDVSGKLVSVTDSGMIGLPSSGGPWPLLLSYKYYNTLTYNDNGKLVKAGRDTFLYNNNNQLIQRQRRITSDTARYWLINTYVYDTQGRLIRDTSFTGQTFLNPSIIPNSISNFSYDANDNINKIDINAVWPAGTSTHTIMMATYDARLNPFKNLGLLPYLAYGNVFFLSTNNQQIQGFQYEYTDNGLLKKIIYNKVVQEYFYE